ncbi:MULTISPECIES: hypothetical protein [unclassified Psychrobacter]|uniref:hypothetical protein n=1 Tax=unclassified Psychrobacter TaxID=196806 RepID=UPI000EB8A1F7|nr:MULTISPECIES: hypothetical protein [unclassified Psychrobacter]MBE8609560.1 hypothetical protein [Pseudomonas lundensis]HCI76211.1 hypothetical protein [Psychrobacter sp.]
MQTNDPALIKTRISENDDLIDSHDSANSFSSSPTSNDKEHSDTDSGIEKNITENKGTDTFKEGVVNSEHVNDNDNPARQPDRRDQEGNAFDDGVNEHTMVSETSKSEGINNMNRYANIDNAQTRVLNPDEKD